MAVAAHVSEQRKVKVAVVGDKQVGKTSLITRFLHGEFSHHYIYTKGGDLEHTAFAIDDQHTVDLVLVDAAGHQYVRSLTKTLYRDVQAVLIVFDVTRENTLKSVEEWQRQIQLVNTTKPPILLAGNKQDLTSHRKVGTEQAEHVSQHLRLPYFETSARTGKNVKETFTRLVSEAWKTLPLCVPEESIVLSYSDIRPRQSQERKFCCAT